MPLARALYSELSDLQATLRDAGYPSAGLPEPDAVSRMFAFWFAMQAFLLMQYRDTLPPQGREEPIPQRLLGTMARFGDSVRRMLRLPVPELADRTSLATTSSWMSMMGSAAGGDNWCRDADGSLTPMELYRNIDPRAPELEMTCSHGHHTEYDDGRGAAPMFKV